MKTQIIAILAVVISTSGALAQTNTTVEYRMVGKEKYDVSKPPFVSVTIPAGSALKNADSIHYSPEAPKPCTVVFQIPAIYNKTKPVKVDIENFPYSPAYFQSGKWQALYKEKPRMKAEIVHNTGGPKTAIQKKIESEESANATKYGRIVDGLVTKEPIALRLFPLSSARTNFNATGEMSVTPARPIYDYGTRVN